MTVWASPLQRMNLQRRLGDIAHSSSSREPGYKGRATLGWGHLTLIPNISMGSAQGHCAQSHSAEPQLGSFPHLPLGAAGICQPHPAMLLPQGSNTRNPRGPRNEPQQPGTELRGLMYTTQGPGPQPQDPKVKKSMGCAVLSLCSTDTASHTLS